MAFQQKGSYDIHDLLEIMDLLRAPGGCPWDREQTHESIRKNFIEETYEVVEAIDNADGGLLKEELGDVLLQVVFHAKIEQEQGTFDFGGVCDAVCKKLIYRHPHIFGDVKADTADKVLRNWEDLKKKEKHQESQTQVLRSVSRVLPALMRSEKVQHRAARVGFDYPGVQWAMKDLRSEVEELREAMDGGGPEEICEELGDLLFSTVNVARFVGTDPEEALTKACDKFISRFEKVEQMAQERNVDMSRADIDLLDNLWREAKNR